MDFKNISSHFLPFLKWRPVIIGGRASAHRNFRSWCRRTAWPEIDSVWSQKRPESRQEVPSKEKKSENAKIRKCASYFSRTQHISSNDIVILVGLEIIWPRLRTTSVQLIPYGMSLGTFHDTSVSQTNKQNFWIHSRIFFGSQTHSWKVSLRTQSSV